MLLISFCRFQSPYYVVLFFFSLRKKLFSMLCSAKLLPKYSFIFTVCRFLFDILLFLFNYFEDVMSLFLASIVCFLHLIESFYLWLQDFSLSLWFFGNLTVMCLLCLSLYLSCSEFTELPRSLGWCFDKFRKVLAGIS